MSNIYGDDCLINGGGSGGGAGSSTKDPLTATDGGGSNPWTNINNVKLDDTNYATFNAFDATDQTNYVILTNFGFQVPAGATITGIVMTPKRYISTVFGSTNEMDARLQFILADIGTQKSLGQYYPSSEGTYDYGASDDLWGAELTPDIVNDETFGVKYKVIVEDATAYLNNIKLTVHYIV